MADEKKHVAQQEPEEEEFDDWYGSLCWTKLVGANVVLQGQENFQHRLSR